MVILTHRMSSRAYPSDPQKARAICAEALTRILLLVSIAPKLSYTLPGAPPGCRCPGLLGLPAMEREPGNTASDKVKVKQSFKFFSTAAQGVGDCI